MCGSTVDIQPPAAEIRPGKKEERRRKRIKTTGQNIMVCPITYRGHKKDTLRNRNV